MGCGLEPGGVNAGLGKICPAASDQSFSGINSGKNAGRFCWAVPNTLCLKDRQGHYLEKREKCKECDFYHMVLAEEGTRNLRTKFLRFVHCRQKESSFLKQLRRTLIKPGKRFVFQGKEMDEAYIIRQGACIVLVEKNGRLYPVDHRSEGDLVNMSALFTGEPSMAHVEAESEIDAWVIKRSEFEDIPKNDPDLWEFLTEIVANRFDSKRPTSYRTIGNYLATDIIGRGGYSIVYRGKDLVSGNPVAIKMMRHHLVLDSDFLARLKKEAHIVDMLAHGNIIKVYDMVERYRTIFIIMEYLEGESILEIIQRHKTISPPKAINYLVQTCQAIHYAYCSGILHKDINPGNLMIVEDDRVKLVDFGLACSIHEDDDIFDGAYPYLAPELLKGERASLQSEIYSLGISAFEMVTGQRPYPEEDSVLFTRMRCEKEIPNPEQIVPELPRGLNQFIVKACKIDPAQRFKNMTEALELLKR
ncbi:putative serine/threonine-specific protein kinase [Desulforapulum autotrophicum HRM2]|uniref:Serine/threonine-specific protein kinase n=2 Tax=Desulforapulum autotrophicum TaxID=2296 RepID=C0QE78_DESAH|nr:putative serine/threonine-specific protein kinase [Desulforapulum autotrophicum HRM2]